MNIFIATWISGLVARVLTLPESLQVGCWTCLQFSCCQRLCQPSWAHCRTQIWISWWSGLRQMRKKKKIFWIWKLGGKVWEFNKDKKLLSPSSYFDVQSTFYASIAVDKERGSILPSPDRSLTLCESKVKASSVRLSGYTVETQDAVMPSSVLRGWQDSFAQYMTEVLCSLLFFLEIFPES